MKYTIFGMLSALWALGLFSGYTAVACVYEVIILVLIVATVGFYRTRSPVKVRRS